MNLYGTPSPEPDFYFVSLHPHRILLLQKIPQRLKRT